MPVLQLAWLVTEFITGYWEFKFCQCLRRTDCGLRTADCGPEVKCRLSAKCRLQTDSKTPAGGTAEWNPKTTRHLGHSYMSWNRSLLTFLSPLFLLYSILGQQLLFKRKHRSVVPIHGYVYRKMKREVSRTEERVWDCDYVFGSSTTL